MIIEILSPGNEKYDMGKKKKLYEKFGVKEYWVVDPLTKDAEGFILKGQSYQSIAKSQGKISLVGLGKIFRF